MHINVTSSKDENNQNLNPNVNNLYDNFLENDFKLLAQNYDGKHDQIFKLIIILEIYL